ncbi:MAG: hypothetical protein KGH98_02475 [Candidatus Micrarchaeota archaeon]|nr:hypothetical protein [Candidatus Micrarchaeota archaeon]
MERKAIIGIVALVLVLSFAALAIGGHQGASLQPINATANGAKQQGAQASGQPVSSSKTLLASTQYAAYSYQIYPGPLSQQAQSALAGFSMNATQLQNSSAKIRLTLTGTSQNQTLVLGPGHKLYIVETTFSDDAFNYDSSLGDDGFIVVDQNGYISQ